MSRAKKPTRQITHQEDPLLNLSEVGRRCGRTSTTIGRWIQDGLLPATKLPSGLVAVRESALDKFLGATPLGEEVSRR